MAFRTTLGLAIALAAVPAPAAFCQEAGAGASVPGAAAPAAPAGASSSSDELVVEGHRARLILKRGTALDGVLPLGTAWEKHAAGAEYVDADPSEPGAGLRLYWVLGMEGSIFFRKTDISEVKDLGTVSEEEKARIRETVLDARRRVLEEREQKLKEEERRIQEAVRKVVGEPAAAPAPVPANPGTGAPESAPAVETPAAVPAAPAEAPKSALPLSPAEELKARAEARRKRGEELYAQFPPPGWSQERYETLLWRQRISKYQPDTLEAAFIKEFDVWQEAVARREKEAKQANKDQPAPLAATAAPAAPQGR